MLSSVAICVGDDLILSYNAMDTPSVWPVDCLYSSASGDSTFCQVGREIALVIKPSLEMCTEHSATPCAVEEAAVAFLQKYGWLD